MTTSQYVACNQMINVHTVPDIKTTVVLDFQYMPNLKQKKLRRQQAKRGRKKQKKGPQCYCHICEAFVMDKKQRHVINKHLQQSLFVCGVCDHGAKNRGQLKKHCAKKHPEEEDWESLLIDNRNGHKEELYRLKTECFGASKQRGRRPKLRNDENNNGTKSIDEEVGEVVQGLITTVCNTADEVINIRIDGRTDDDDASDDVNIGPSFNNETMIVSDEDEDLYYSGQ